MGFWFGLKSYVPLLVYLFLIGLVFLVVFKDTKYGILYFFPLFPMISLFTKMQKFPLGKDVIDILVLAIILGSLVQNKDFVKTQINKPLYAFILLTFLALLNGYMFLGKGLQLGDGRTQMWKNYMIMPILFFIVVNNIKKIDEIKKLVFHMSIIYLVMGVKFALVFVDPGYFKWSAKVDLGLLDYLGANQLASFMAVNMAIFLSLSYFIQNKKYRIYYFAAALVGGYNILFLFSRAAYLASAVLMFILGIIRDRKILVALIILILFWQIILPHSVFQRINMTINAEDNMGGTSIGRGAMWEHAYSLFLTRPMFGVGYETFEYTISEDQKDIFFQHIGRAITDTHSIYFNVLAEMGIIGLGLLLFLFFLAARSGWRLFRLTRNGFLKGLGLGFFLSVIVYMITNAFGDRWRIYHLASYYWIFWALTERGLMLTREHLQADRGSDGNSHIVRSKGS